MTIASLPRTADVALERDALMGFLQFGHRLDPDAARSGRVRCRSGIPPWTPSARPSQPRRT